MRVRIDRDSAGWNDPGWAVLVIGAVAVAAMMVLRPWLPFFPACPFHALTGLPCLTCGSTRAFAALVAGEWLVAVKTQPLAMAGCAGAAIVGVHALVAMVTGRRIAIALTRQDRLLIRCAAVAAVLINWAYLLGAGI